MGKGIRARRETAITVQWYLGWLEGFAADAPEDAAEEAEDATQVRGREREAVQEQAKMVAVGLLHGTRGIARGGHGLFNEIGEAIELGGGGGGVRRLLGFGVESRDGRGARELIEADGDGLAEIHGGLARVSGDFNQNMAEG